MKTKTTFTPGPWKHAIARSGHESVYAADGTPIVKFGEGQDEEWVEPKNAKANARLIAASPNMLVALKAILTVTARHGGTNADADAIAAIEQLAAVAVRDAEGR